MGISLQEYRCRIGNFLPKNSSTVQKQSKSSFRDMIPSRVFISAIMTTALILSLVNIQGSYMTNFYNLSYQRCTGPISFQQASCHQELSNFYARYLYGNKQDRGIKIAHFNKGPGYLVSKRNEIEHLISGLHPHVLGISEANYFKNQDYDEVQISDYIFHTSPTLDNETQQNYNIYSQILTLQDQT